ncbi:hypothetical protein BCR33DRAFT_713261 [Rhizoclosmatium globosum]|uniref:C3H1-type domain-containing protein n=1 Tax=Rhizoclosmatium globosum TaxID=329046 RepID=A0A1Y2CU26_9FUNG|nr:hypothetical protein BCR33DRAFT_713261 [Rhizoclosmatium globosum]|eukprot:ORY50467.1 hypothetical protein BCR33DRAFT_713261 [Rhizoclosmatium globosum]
MEIPIAATQLFERLVFLEQSVHDLTQKVKRLREEEEAEHHLRNHTFVTSLPLTANHARSNLQESNGFNLISQRARMQSLVTPHESNVQIPSNIEIHERLLPLHAPLLTPPTPATPPTSRTVPCFMFQNSTCRVKSPSTCEFTHACLLCFSPLHALNACPDLTHDARRYCLFFQRDKKWCRAKRCPRRHVCVRCGSNKHGRLQCDDIDRLFDPSDVEQVVDEVVEKEEGEI